MLTRNDAAYHLRLAVNTLFRYEHSEVSMSLETAEAAAELYGAELKELRGEAGAVRTL